MSVSQMPVSQMPVGQMSVGQMSVGQMSLGQMSVGQMSLGQMSVGQISFGQMFFNRTTRNHPICYIYFSEVLGQILYEKALPSTLSTDPPFKTFSSRFKLTNAAANISARQLQGHTETINLANE